MADVTIFSPATWVPPFDGGADRRCRRRAHRFCRSEATVEGDIDIVILAVLYPALEAIVAESGPQLAGKAVVDISNPPDGSRGEFRGSRTR